MKSQTLLTRQLFRAILTNRSYRIPGCPLRPIVPKQHDHVRSFNTSQSRQIFGLSFGAPARSFEGAKATSANVEAALSKLVDLLKSKRTRSRQPSDEELVDAFRFLFTTRADRSKPLTRNEAFLATETFNHLRSKELILSEISKVSLTTQDLQNVLLALAAPAGGEIYRSDYQALAKAVFDIVRQYPDLDPLVSAGFSTSGDGLRNHFFESYATVLARTGSARKALDMVRNADDAVQPLLTTLWATILKSLALEGSVSDFWEALVKMHERLGPLDSSIHQDLCTFFAGRDDIDNTLKMFELELKDGLVPTNACLAAVLRFCIRTGQADLGAKIASILRTRTDMGDTAGTLLVYFASVDPSVRNIRAQVNELAKNDSFDVVNMASFNALIQYAYSRRDPGLAQTYIDLARSCGLRPDGSTWVLRLDFELSRGDLDSAKEAFEALSLEDIPKDRSDVPVLNRYITVLSASENASHEHLMRVVDSILETGADVDPEAVASLCRVFLRRDELEEASGLLRYRIDTFPNTDRARIGAVFEHFIQDPNIKDQRAWNAYDLLRHALPETEVEHRIAIMQSFFDRNRPDLACLVFGHMRQREDLEARPTPEAYAQCFHGIAKCKDVDGLQMVYNMLKMDLEVEQTTKIHNTLMQANTACRSPFTSIIDHFWKILDSREGPTLNSFALALQACQTWVPQGSQEARRIMAMMQSWNLIITKEIYDCYVGALAGQSEFENTVELIDHMEEDIGEAPDFMTIGTFYNAIPFQYRKDAVEAWAKKAYPELWEDLLACGDEIDEDWAIRYFKIDQSIDLNDELLFGQGEYSPELAKRSQLTIEEPTG
jgi:tetratricopeptide (TPR) repeat protein